MADRDESLHPIPVKPEERQALQGLHRLREQWKSARTARICEARALLAEFGVSIPKGTRGIGRRLTAGAEHAPELLQATLLDLIREIDELQQRIKGVDDTLAAYADTDCDVQVSLGINGVGVTRMVQIFEQARSLARQLRRYAPMH